MNKKKEQFTLSDFIEYLSKDGKSHQKGEIVAHFVDTHQISLSVVASRRKEAEKKGFKIPATKNGYMLLPDLSGISNPEQVMHILNFATLSRKMYEVHYTKFLKSQEFEKLIDPAYVSSVYTQFVNGDDIVYIPGDLKKMGPHLSPIQRESLKAMDYRKEFLKTRFWKIVRAAVREIADGKCQYCNQEPGTECHHTTYDHHGWEDEHLEELMWVCRPCHEMLENEKDE